jgi:hypothetical protein
VLSDKLLAQSLTSGAIGKCQDARHQTATDTVQSYANDDDVVVVERLMMKQRLDILAGTRTARTGQGFKENNNRLRGRHTNSGSSATRWISFKAGIGILFLVGPSGRIVVLAAMIWKAIVGCDGGFVGWQRELSGVLFTSSFPGCRTR